MKILASELKRIVDNLPKGRDIHHGYTLHVPIIPKSEVLTDSKIIAPPIADLNILVFTWDIAVQDFVLDI